MSRYDFADTAFAVFLGGIFLAVFAVISGTLIDSYASYKAQPAAVACAQRQMNTFRYFLSDSVVCVPYPARQDTTTVQVRQ